KARRAIARPCGQILTNVVAGCEEGILALQSQANDAVRGETPRTIRDNGERPIDDALGIVGGGRGDIEIIRERDPRAGILVESIDFDDGRYADVEILRPSGRRLAKRCSNRVERMGLKVD